MISPGDRSHFEDLAALHTLGLLDQMSERELFSAAEREPEIAALVREAEESAVLLAYEAPQVQPPADLRTVIMDQLPARAAKSKIVSFSYLLPYAIAACLMILGISQAQKVAELNGKLATATAIANKFAASDALKNLQLLTLAAKDAAYGSAKIVVAWDPNRNRGIVSTDSLPPAPAGHDYQLWILDPGAPAPLSAGVLTGPKAFQVASVSTGGPGFAVSLEPTGGSPEPIGPILFAVAPGT